ncbi:MAG: lipid A-modifier LpxR family protein [Oceanicaulis sp.]
MNKTASPSLDMTRAAQAASAFALCAGAVFAAAAPASALQQPPAAEVDARTMTLAPFYEEMQALPRQPGAAFGRSADVSGLRFAPADTAGQRFTLTRPAAADFAGSVLNARAEPVSRNSLSAFDAPGATIASLGSSGRLSVAFADADRPGLAQLSFDPEFAESAGRAFGVEDRASRMAVRYESSFDTTGSDGLDFGLAPRAGLSVGDDGATAAEAGATVRLGQYLDNDFDRPAWWFFAGADRQAVMYDPGQGLDMRDAFAMEPYALVGDAQAGVAMRMGPADVSFAYVMRETEYSMPSQSWDTTENFAAFSLTWRR